MENRKVLNHLIFMFFIATMSSCSHSFYAPNDNMMVQLKDKNELTISGTAGFTASSLNNSTEYNINTAQVGYSPMKHVALAGSFFNLNVPADGNSIASGKGKIFNGAIGTYYFQKLGGSGEEGVSKSEKTSAMQPIGFLYDFYAGYGQGDVNHVYDNGSRANLNFQNYFIQGGFHFLTPFVDVGVTLKKSILNYYDAKTFGETSLYDENEILHLMDSNPYSPFQVTFRVAGGFKYGKVYMNFNNAIDPSSDLKIADPNFALGLKISVHDILRAL